jgi:hypothetical protein
MSVMVAVRTFKLAMDFLKNSVVAAPTSHVSCRGVINDEGKQYQVLVDLNPTAGYGN